MEGQGRAGQGVILILAVIVHIHVLKAAWMEGQGPQYKLAVHVHKYILQAREELDGRAGSDEERKICWYRKKSESGPAEFGY